MKKKRRTAKANNTPAFFSTRPGKLMLWIAIIVLLLIFFLHGPRGTVELIKNSHHKNQLEKEIQDLEQTKTRLDSEKVILNDDSYIEKTAREQYNMKKQGEKVYKIEKDSN